jgi:hypothetical protein
MELFCPWQTGLWNASAKLHREEIESGMGDAKEHQNAPMWREIDGLRQQTVGQLKVKYCAVFGWESRSNHKQFLLRRIAWRLQANAEGGLSERARQRALALAEEADLRIRAPESFLKKLANPSGKKPCDSPSTCPRPMAQSRVPRPDRISRSTGNRFSLSGACL